MTTIIITTTTTTTTTKLDTPQSFYINYLTWLAV